MARTSGDALSNSTAQHSTAQHSTAQHSTAQHSTAQHSTAQHSTAQHLHSEQVRARSHNATCARAQACCPWPTRARTATARSFSSHWGPRRSVTVRAPVAAGGACMGCAAACLLLLVCVRVRRGDRQQVCCRVVAEHSPRHVSARARQRVPLPLAPRPSPLAPPPWQASTWCLARWSRGSTSWHA
jgi:hypothetical protein